MCQDNYENWQYCEADSEASEELDYQDSNKKFYRPESWNQIQLIKWVRANLDTYPELDMLFSVPNGHARPTKAAKLVKREGQKNGVADLILWHPSGPYHGARLELKAPHRNRQLSADQEAFLIKSAARGYATFVRRYWQERRDWLITYLDYPEELVTTF